LHLTPAGVALRLVADDRATLQTLDGGAAALPTALEAAHLKHTGQVIEPRAVAPNREVASDA
ncbi:MAG: flagellar hook-length control protein FliK, partial [Proteobacteria bacterium]|nr:flagellar hook-length control protein FliK [Pseudomonadota bacterium]